MKRAAGAVLAGLLLSGCDVVGHTALKPAPKTLTHAQLVRAANRACANELRRLKGLKFDLGHPEKILEQERTIVVRAEERLLFALRGLAPPPADVAAFRHFLASLNHEDLVVHNALDAAAAHQIPRLNGILRRLGIVGRQVASGADKLGLHTCARA